MRFAVEDAKLCRSLVVFSYIQAYTDIETLERELLIVSSHLNSEKDSLDSP